MHLKTKVFAKFGRQTKCIMAGNVKMVNIDSITILLSLIVGEIL